jgi:hypothetical protein
VVLSIYYVAIQRILRLVLFLFRSTEFKEPEILVLRHELSGQVAVFSGHAGDTFCAGTDAWWRTAGPVPAKNSVRVGHIELADGDQ